MMDEQQLRRKRLMDAMANSINSQPLTTNTSDPNIAVQPRPTTPTAPTTPLEVVQSAPQPVPEGQAPTPQPPPVRITYGPKGLSGVDSMIAQREAMQNEGARSKIFRNSEGQIEVDAPKPARHGFKGVLKNIGEGILTGLAGDPNDPNNDDPNKILGRAIGGGTVAGVNRDAGPQLKRRFEMRQLDNDLARGLALEGEDAQLGGLRALTRQRELEPGIQLHRIDEETRIANERLKLEQDKQKGVITKQQYDQKNDELNRQSREKVADTNYRARVDAAGVSAGGRGSARQDKLDETDAKRSAAQAELEQLTSDEAEAGRQKNEAYAALAQFRKDNPNSRDIDQMEQEAQRLNTVYQSFGEKKRDAQRRINENVRGTSGGGVTLQGALDAFKKAAKRDPTDAEIENIKKHYGLQ